MVDSMISILYAQCQSNCFTGLPWWIASWDEPGISEACARHGHSHERPRAKANSDTHVWPFLHHWLGECCSDPARNKSTSTLNFEIHGAHCPRMFCSLFVSSQTPGWINCEMCDQKPVRSPHSKSNQLQRFDVKAVKNPPITLQSDRLQDSSGTDMHTGWCMTQLAPMPCQSCWDCHGRDRTGLASPVS